MENVDVVRIIDEARGFLNALRKLCLPPAIAWIGLQRIEHDLPSAIERWIKEDGECTYGEQTDIDGLAVRRFLRTHLFGRLMVTEGQRSTLEATFSEYVDLASDADAAEVEFGRLWRHQSVFVEVSHTDLEMNGCLVLPLTTYIVVVVLGTATNREPA